MNVIKSNLTVLLKISYVKHGDPPPSMPPGLDANQATRFQTDKGTWLFMPFGSDPVGEDRPPSGNSQKSARRRKRRNRQGPPSYPSSHGTEEQGESEVPTIDPSVDPDGFGDEAPMPVRPQPQRGVPQDRRRGVQQLGGGGGSPAGSPAGSSGEQKSSATSWMSAMGPQKGREVQRRSTATTSYLEIPTWRCGELSRDTKGR